MLTEVFFPLFLFLFLVHIAQPHLYLCCFQNRILNFFLFVFCNSSVSFKDRNYQNNGTSAPLLHFFCFVSFDRHNGILPIISYSSYPWNLGGGGVLKLISSSQQHPFLDLWVPVHLLRWLMSSHSISF